MDDFFDLFKAIDKALSDRFGVIALPFKIIGRAALELAGLPERGTKDVDTLEHELRVKTLTENEVAAIEDFLKREFGKGSPGNIRHGLYLDLVGNIAWLPKNPRFIDIKKYSAVNMSRLHSADVCVSKIFSNFKNKHDRGRDLADIIEALDARLVDGDECLKRLDESFPIYEQHAEAASAFPRLIEFINGTIIPHYCSDGAALKYSMPSWMENM